MLKQYIKMKMTDLDFLLLKVAKVDYTTDKGDSTLTVKDFAFEVEYTME